MDGNLRREGGLFQTSQCRSATLLPIPSACSVPLAEPRGEDPLPTAPGPLRGRRQGADQRITVLRTQVNIVDSDRDKSHELQDGGHQRPQSGAKHRMSKGTVYCIASDDELFKKLVNRCEGHSERMSRVLQIVSRRGSVNERTPKTHTQPRVSSPFPSFCSSSFMVHGALASYRVFEASPLSSFPDQEREPRHVNVARTSARREIVRDVTVKMCCTAAGEDLRPLGGKHHRRTEC